MRKVIIALVTIAVMLAFVAYPAFGDVQQAGSSQVLARVDNTFSVKIPAVIDLSDGTDKSKVTINYAMLENKKVINVYNMNEDSIGIPLYHTNQQDIIRCKIRNLETNEIAYGTNKPICTFRQSDIEDYTATKEFGLEPAKVGKVGSYSGVLVYAFAIESQ